MSAISAIRTRFIRECVNRIKSNSRQSRLKNYFVASFAIGFEIVLFLVFLGGLKFINALGGAGRTVIPHLFSIYFLALSVMLFFSGLASAYATFFRASDIPMLFTSPLTQAHCTLIKLAESTGLSSWAFVFIVTPFVAAYASFADVSPMFVVWVLLFSLPLIVLCSSLAVAITLLVGRIFPRRKGTIRIVVVLSLTVMIAIIAVAIKNARAAESAREVTLATIVPGLRLASHPLMPSMWTADGIMSLTRGRLARGMMLWLMLASSAIAALILAEAIGNRVYHKAWTRLAGTDQSSRSPLLGRWLCFALSPLPADIRALIIKDIRTFLRDPMQWSQALVFFGILTAYFANLRNLNYDQFPLVWRNLIAFLNAFGVATVVSALAARFAYPQLSLEGHGYWILGLSPSRPARILLTKFAVTAVLLTAATTILMLLSTRMINAPRASRNIILTASICLSMSVTATAIGLGAVFIDQKHRNPAAIISGFGGTLNLLISLGLTFAIHIPAAVIFHTLTAGKRGGGPSQGITIAIYAWVLILSTCATLIPLTLGIRSLSKRDF